MEKEEVKEPQVTVNTAGDGEDDYIKEATGSKPNVHRAAEEIEYEETKADGEDPHAAKFTSEPTTPDPEEAAAKTEELAVSFSDLIVEGMDMMNNILLPMVYESQVMGELDNDVVKSFRRKYERVKVNENKKVSTAIEFTVQEEEAADLYIQVKEYAEKAPFTDAEKDKLKSTLKAWFVQMNWHVELPPWVQVLIVFGTIEGKRLLPVAKKPMKQLFSKKKQTPPAPEPSNENEQAA